MIMLFDEKLSSALHIDEDLFTGQNFAVYTSDSILIF